MRSCPLKSPLPQVPKEAWAIMSRRDWVKRLAVGTVAAVGASGWKSTLLADISPAADPGNIVSLRVSDYPVLQEDYGSLRFSLFGSSVPNGVITITRAPGSIFYSTSAYCTHQGCIVDPYLAGDTNAMICYCHNSVYDIQGHIISPAEVGQANLPAYNTSFSGGVVKVEIPGLNVKVNSTSLVQVGQNTRFRITFAVRNGGRYRVLYTPDLTTTPSVVSFSNTETGPIGSTQFNAGSSGTKTVWVAATGQRGFFFVELRVDEYVV